MVRDDQNGFDYMGVFIVGWREMHHVVELVFDRRDPAIKRKPRTRCSGP